MVEIIKSEVVRSPKDVVLVHPPSPMLEKEGMVPPLGLLLLATILKKKGHLVSAVDIRDREVDTARLLDCQILLFSSVTTPQYNRAKDILKMLSSESQKRSKKMPITAIGGPHASYLGDEIVKDGWSFVYRGFGEEGVIPLVEGQLPEGLITGQLTMTEEQLNQYPIPDLGLIGDLDSYKRSQDYSPTLPIMTSRGCPHDCSFCSNGLWRRTVRFYRPEKVIAMANDIKNRGIDQIVFYDDDALINKDNRVLAISRGITPLDVLWRCNTHVNTIDNPIAKKSGILEVVKDSGCVLVSLGIDGVDNETLKLYNKETTIDRCRRAIGAVKKAGILVKIFVVYPPGGGLGYVRKAENFIRETEPDFVQFSVKTALPGSRDYEKLENQGLINGYHWDQFYYQSKPGEYGNSDVLNGADSEALKYLNCFLDKWRQNKAEMPI
jgi:anaerobic magnesium-protoporphyrin IX monomethyl ester cyclase